MLIVCISNKMKCSIYCIIFRPSAESQSSLTSSALIYKHSVLRMPQLDQLEFVKLFEESLHFSEDMTDLIKSFKSLNSNVRV